MQHGYTKILFVVYLKFKFNHVFCILPGNLDMGLIWLSTDMK